MTSLELMGLGFRALSIEVFRFHKFFNKIYDHNGLMLTTLVLCLFWPHIITMANFKEVILCFKVFLIIWECFAFSHVCFQLSIVYKFMHSSMFFLLICVITYIYSYFWNLGLHFVPSKTLSANVDFF